MKFIKFWTLAAGATAMLALGACSPKPGEASKSPAAATVNGMPISQRTVDMIVKQGASSGRPDTPEVRRAIVDQLALQMVASEEAVKKGLDKTPEVADQISAIKQGVLANAYVEDFIKNNPVSDETLKAEYERIKATITGTEYKARHILVEQEAEAKDIIARLKKDPGAFAKLAMEKSKDSGSAARGGELGWFDPRRMVPEFSAALSNLEKGKFTEVPVKTQFGYHVILLEDSRAIEAPPFDEVKPKLSQQLQQQSVKKQLDALKAAAKIEVAGAASAAPDTPATK
ncbi:MAG TPA: peptidylprolyl isomerase [Burkholderiaceae bacterium]|nr:peptidylprolyl isomerase [Burkholderiaceae bacterium]